MKTASFILVLGVLLGSVVGRGPSRRSRQWKDNALRGRHSSTDVESSRMVSGQARGEPGFVRPIARHDKEEVKNLRTEVGGVSQSNVNAKTKSMHMGINDMSKSHGTMSSKGSKNPKDHKKTSKGSTADKEHEEEEDHDDELPTTTHPKMPTLPTHPKTPNRPPSQSHGEGNKHHAKQKNHSKHSGGKGHQEGNKSHSPTHNEGKGHSKGTSHHSNTDTEKQHKESNHPKGSSRHHGKPGKGNDSKGDSNLHGTKPPKNGHMLPVTPTPDEEHSDEADEDSPDIEMEEDAGDSVTVKPTDEGPTTLPDSDASQETDPTSAPPGSLGVNTLDQEPVSRTLPLAAFHYHTLSTRQTTSDEFQELGKSTSIIFNTLYMQAFPNISKVEVRTKRWIERIEKGDRLVLFDVVIQFRGDAPDQIKVQAAAEAAFRPQQQMHNEYMKILRQMNSPVFSTTTSLRFISDLNSLKEVEQSITAKGGNTKSKTFKTAISVATVLAALFILLGLCCVVRVRRRRRYASQATVDFKQNKDEEHDIEGGTVDESTMVSDYRTAAFSDDGFSSREKKIRDEQSALLDDELEQVMEEMQELEEVSLAEEDDAHTTCSVTSYLTTNTTANANANADKAGTQMNLEPSILEIETETDFINNLEPATASAEDQGTTLSSTPSYVDGQNAQAQPSPPTDNASRGPFYHFSKPAPAPAPAPVQALQPVEEKEQEKPKSVLAVAAMFEANRNPIARSPVFSKNRFRSSPTQKANTPPVIPVMKESATSDKAAVEEKTSTPSTSPAVEGRPQPTSSSALMRSLETQSNGDDDDGKVQSPKANDVDLTLELPAKTNPTEVQIENRSQSQDETLAQAASDRLPEDPVGAPPKEANDGPVQVQDETVAKANGECIDDNADGHVETPSKSTKVEASVDGQVPPSATPAVETNVDHLGDALDQAGMLEVVIPDSIETPKNETQTATPAPASESTPANEDTTPSWMKIGQQGIPPPQVSVESSASSGVSSPLPFPSNTSTSPIPEWMKKFQQMGLSKSDE